MICPDCHTAMTRVHSLVMTDLTDRHPRVTTRLTCSLCTAKTGDRRSTCGTSIAIAEPAEPR